MTTPSNQRYNIFFAGECLEGHRPEDVRAAVAKLFAADAATLQRLFSGKRQRIKRDCDESTALQYQSALQRAGARATVEPSTAAAEPNAQPQKDDAGSPAPTIQASNTILSLAPAGSDVLGPDERHSPASVVVETNHLSLATQGPLATTEPRLHGEPLAIPDFGLADLGADLSSKPAPTPPPAPDTSGIALSPNDYDLSDCAPPAPDPPGVNIDGLDLAAIGADIGAPATETQTQRTTHELTHLSLTPTDEPDN